MNTLLPPNTSRTERNLATVGANAQKPCRSRFTHSGPLDLPAPAALSGCQLECRPLG